MAHIKVVVPDRKYKPRIKDSMITLRTYSELVQMVEKEAAKEDKTVREFIIKCLTERLGLNFMDFK